MLTVEDYTPDPDDPRRSDVGSKIVFVAAVIALVVIGCFLIFK